MNRDSILDLNRFHPTKSHELVLRVQRPLSMPGKSFAIKAFYTRDTANHALKQNETR